MGRFSELKSRIEKNSFNYAFILLAILLIIVVVNVFYAFSTNSVLKEKVSEIKEFKRAAEIELVVINCDGCSDVAAIIENIKSKNVELDDELKEFLGFFLRVNQRKTNRFRLAIESYIHG